MDTERARQCCQIYFDAADEAAPDQETAVELLRQSTKALLDGMDELGISDKADLGSSMYATAIAMRVIMDQLQLPVQLPGDEIIRGTGYYEDLFKSSAGDQPSVEAMDAFSRQAFRLHMSLPRELKFLGSAWMVAFIHVLKRYGLEPPVGAIVYGGHGNTDHPSSLH